MSSISQIPLVNGAAPAIMVAVVAVGLLWLATGRRVKLARVLGCVAVTALAMGLFWFLAEEVWNLWGGPLPRLDYVYLGAGLLALLLALPKIRSLHARGARLAVLPVATAVLLSGAGLVNQNFEYYPTIGSLYGDIGAPVLTLRDYRAQHGQPPALSAGTGVASTERNWVPPANMPLKGQVLRVQIPGTVSGERSAPAYVYLPPAYLSSPRANLPVLVLIHGVPGGPIDWLRGGQVNQFMDRYAAANHGLAPVVVMPDAAADHAKFPPLCLDSRQGQGATYLTQDVPNWVKQTLGAGTLSARQWAIGGFSYGGTCAMTLAVNHPQVYPTFIDSSGESSPTIDQGRSTLLNKYFDGSAAAFAKQDALSVLKTRKYSGVAGIVTVGADDRHYKPQGVEVYKAMRRAGMDVRLEQAPGGHAWPAWRYGVYENMDWLMGRLGAGS